MGALSFISFKPFAILFRLPAPSLRERAEEETLHDSYPAEEDAMHFLGKMKKMLFSLEKKEKKCNFALEGSKTVHQPLRADTHFLLRARCYARCY